MKKILALLVFAVVILAFPGRVKADYDCAEEATLYFVDDKYGELLTNDSSHPFSYTIKAWKSGATVSVVEYKSYSGNVTITDGVVTPTARNVYNLTLGKNQKYYNEDEMVLKVTSGSKITYVRIKIVDYTKAYVNEKITALYNSYYDKSLSKPEQLKAFTKAVAENYNYAGATTIGGSYCALYTKELMVLYGGGDCWASTDLIIELAKRAGIECKPRVAYNDLGAGSGHRNVIAEIDGKYYIADAGYGEAKPRRYKFVETDGYSFRSNSDGYYLYQYDGSDPVLVVPEKTPSGETVTGLCAANMYAEIVTPLTKITKLVIPATIKTVNSDRFLSSYMSELKEIVVDENNEYYTSKDGALYTKDFSELVILPATGVKTYVMDNRVKSISDYAMYVADFEYLVLSEGMTALEDKDLPSMNYKSVKGVVIPESITDFSEYAIPELWKSVTIMGKAGSAAETYCTEKGLTFIALKAGDVTLDGTTDIKDLTRLARHVAEIEPAENPGELMNADVDGVKGVDIKDLTRLARHVAEIEPLAQN